MIEMLAAVLVGTLPPAPCSLLSVDEVRAAAGGEARAGTGSIGVIPSGAASGDSLRQCRFIIPGTRSELVISLAVAVPPAHSAAILDILAHDARALSARGWHASTRSFDGVRCSTVMPVTRSSQSMISLCAGVRNGSALAVSFNSHTRQLLPEESYRLWQLAASRIDAASGDSHGHTE